MGFERHRTVLWACVVSLDEAGGTRRACATGSISIPSVNLYIVLCSCGGKAGFGLVRGTVREVCHSKCKMCSDSMRMGTCCPVRRISKDAGAAVQRPPVCDTPLLTNSTRAKEIQEKGTLETWGQCWSVQSLGLCRRALQFQQ